MWRPRGGEVGSAASRGAIADALARLVSHRPFQGRVAVEGLSVHRLRAARVVACVPAVNEDERIAASLQALEASLLALDEPAVVVVLVNNSTDGTAGTARDVAREASASFVVCEARFAREIADAGHARRLALDVGSLVAPNGVLLTTDADTRVGRDWAPRLVNGVRGGAAAVAGWIETDPHEFACLPPAVRAAEACERALFAAQDALWRRLVPDAPLALGLRVGGASLAVSARAYARVGGLPTPAAGEDRAMVALLQRHDEIVILDRHAPIETSCRLDARAANGMGAMLENRLSEADPPCDEALMPARDFALRALAWRQLRRARHAPASAALLADGRLIAEALRVPFADVFPSQPTHGADWERLDARMAPLPRLRVSDVRRETRYADALLETLPEPAGNGPAVADAVAAIEATCSAGRRAA